MAVEMFMVKKVPNIVIHKEKRHICALTSDNSTDAIQYAKENRINLILTYFDKTQEKWTWYVMKEVVKNG